jgi:hypothetical protein
MPALAALKSHPVRGAALRRRLLVIELGSSSVAQVSPGDFDETLAIPQLQDERPVAFMQRVMDRIALVEQSGGAFDSAVLMTGGRHDSATRAARRLLVSGLAAHARAGAGLSDVVVNADASADPQARQELLELVDELLASSEQQQPFPIRLRFNERGAGGEEPSSGVFWRAPARNS